MNGFVLQEGSRAFRLACCGKVSEEKDVIFAKIDFCFRLMQDKYSAENIRKKAAPGGAAFKLINVKVEISF